MKTIKALAAAVLAGHYRWKDFSGRSNRLEFWSYYLSLCVLQSLLGATDSIITTGIDAEDAMILLLPAMFATTALMIWWTVGLSAAMIRRVRDAGFSPAFVVVSLISDAAFVTSFLFDGLRGTASSEAISTPSIAIGIVFILTNFIVMAILVRKGREPLPEECAKTLSA